MLDIAVGYHQDKTLPLERGALMGAATPLHPSAAALLYWAAPSD